MPLNNHLNQAAGKIIGKSSKSEINNHKITVFGNKTLCRQHKSLSIVDHHPCLLNIRVFQQFNSKFLYLNWSFLLF